MRDPIADGAMTSHHRHHDWDIIIPDRRTHDGRRTFMIELTESN
jgi:hypothetical protein